MLNRVIFALAAACLSLAGGCASNRHAESLPGGLSEAPDLPISIFDRTGQSASYYDLLDASLAADAILIGETHGHPVGLELAATLFEDILESRPTAALSMEFYERDQQAALDDYLSGVTDNEAFKVATKRTEGNDPPGHRRMVEAAKKAGAPVIAANAPRRYVTLSRKEGYDRLRALSPEQRRLFSIPSHLPEGRYREDFAALMGPMFGSGAHGEPVPEDEIPAMVDAALRSQSLWDATMSNSVARALPLNTPVVQVIGRFHTDFGGGTVQLLLEQRPATRILTISMIDHEPGELDAEDLGRADFVVYAGQVQSESEPEEPSEPDEPSENEGS